jgi:hypothetical protein
MASSDAFHAGDDAGPALWPEPPAWMSHSSLKEAELCPRRWALRRASYPKIWDKPGYPDMPSLPSLIGDVTHDALEKILAEVPPRLLKSKLCLRRRSAQGDGWLYARDF